CSRKGNGRLKPLAGHPLPVPATIFPDAISHAAAASTLIPPPPRRGHPYFRGIGRDIVDTFPHTLASLDRAPRVPFRALRCTRGGRCTQARRPFPPAQWNAMWLPLRQLSGASAHDTSARAFLPPALAAR